MPTQYSKENDIGYVSLPATAVLSSLRVSFWNGIVAY